MFLQRRPRGFTLMEFLLVIAITVVMVGLFLPAVQRALEAAAEADCANKLKQISLGFQNAAGAHDGLLPPGIGWYPGRQFAVGGASGSAMFHLLPFIEQEALYKQSFNGTIYNGRAYKEGFSDQKVKAFLCPSDPSASDGIVTDENGTRWGACSYASNAQVFTVVSSTGRLLDWQGSATMSRTFADGTTNTILLADKYARCVDDIFPDGGNVWPFAEVDHTIKPLHAAFAVSWHEGSFGTGSHFLVRPRWDDCDPSLASTPHRVMQVAFADGAVKRIPGSIAGGVWWSLCTPNGGEVVNEW